MYVIIMMSLGLLWLRVMMINIHVVERLTWKCRVESPALTETCTDTKFHVIELCEFMKMGNFHIESESKNWISQCMGREYKNHSNPYTRYYCTLWYRVPPDKQWVCRGMQRHAQIRGINFDPCLFLYIELVHALLIKGEGRDGYRDQIVACDVSMSLQSTAHEAGFLVSPTYMNIRCTLD